MNLDQRSVRVMRIVTVVAATLISLSCGTNYTFSAWSPSFSARLGLTATETNLIGTFGNIGMYAMGIPGGLLVDSRDPRWGALIGCLTISTGYFALWAAFAGGPGHSSVAVLCFFSLLTGIGSSTAFSAALKVCATNFPHARGTATAFPLSAYGLSAFFYTAIAALMPPNDTSGYLLLLACGTAAMFVVGTFFLQIRSPVSAYEALPTDEQHRRKDSNPLRRTSLSRPRQGDDFPEESGLVNEASSLVSSDSVILSDTEERAQADARGKPEITGFRVFRTIQFWELFFMLCVLSGVGLMTINNIGLDTRCLWRHYDDTASPEFVQKRQLVHVSILSFASFTGRLCSGIGSDQLVRRGASRVWTLVASACLFAAGQLVALGLDNPNHLYWLSGLTGLAYGALYGVFPAIVADAFGSTGMGINWGAIIFAPVISGNVFNLAFGSILDQHSHFESGNHGHDERVCDDGKACYSGAYWLTLCASVVGTVWSLWLIRQEKHRKAGGNRPRQHREHQG